MLFMLLMIKNGNVFFFFVYTHTHTHTHTNYCYLFKKYLKKMLTKMANNSSMLNIKH